MAKRVAGRGRATARSRKEPKGRPRKAAPSVADVATGQGRRTDTPKASTRDRTRPSLRLLGVDDYAVSRAVIDTFPSGLVYALDTNLRVVAAGGRSPVPGIDPGSRVGRRLAEFVPAEEWKDLEPLFRLALDGVASCREARIRGIEVEARFEPVKGPDGRVALVVFSAQGIADRKALQSALKTSQERLELVIEGSNDGYWDWDVEGRRIVVSGRWQGIVGLHTEGDERILDFQEWYGRIHPDDLGSLHAASSKMIEGTSPQLEAEYRLRAEDESWKWVRVRGRVVARDGAAKPTRVAGTMTDITTFRELQRAQEEAIEALRRSEELHRTIASHFPNGALALFDKDLRVILFDGTAPLVAQDTKSVVGKTLREFAPPELLADVETAWRDALQGRAGHCTVRYLGRAVDLVTHPVRDAAGRVTMGLLITQDITKRLALEARVAMAGRLAAMGTLVAGLAHEINNPLAGEMATQGLAITSVRRLMERIRAGQPLDDEAAKTELTELLELLDEARQDTERIARVVKDLTLFGRQDTLRLPVRLIDVVDSALRWLRVTVEQSATVKVTNRGAPDVLAARGQLEQVVVNLVNNAAKATHPGRRGAIGIRVGPGRSGWARLDVTDNGTGIAGDVIGRVFDPFFTTREVGKGMGLGLAISHVIVDAHGGTIIAQSKVGWGSRFRVELPVAPAES
jgi:two-component system, cell cycle sensor histidine kinase and response regulator CckA